MSVIIGPVPPYSNPPIEPQFFKPSQFFILNITLGVTTIVTSTTNMNYVVGQLVRLLIPSSFGCRQLNGQTGYVISIPNLDQVELDINSLEGDLFILSSASTRPQIVAVGDINSGVKNTTGRQNTGTFIPGSYINISPL